MQKLVEMNYSVLSIKKTQSFKTSTNAVFLVQNKYDDIKIHSEQMKDFPFFYTVMIDFIIHMMK